MSQLNGRKLTLIRMHAPIHAPNIKGLGTLNTIDKNTGGNKEGLELIKVDDGILITVKSTGTEVWVPSGNIVNGVLESEIKLAKETKEVKK